MKSKNHKSQYGWTIVEIHRDEAGLYLIEDGKGNRYHVPCALWDMLKTTTERSQEYRKSRNYYREARETDKKTSVEIYQKLEERNKKLIHDFNNELSFYQDDIRDLEGQIRNLKAYLIVTCVSLLSCLIFILI